MKAAAWLITLLSAFPSMAMQKLQISFPKTPLSPNIKHSFMLPAQKLLRNSHSKSCDHTCNYALQEIDESFVPEAGKFAWIYPICTLDKVIHPNK